MLPNLIIPGAQKSGTTYLAQLLSQHPDIYLPTVKEPAHFLARHAKPLVKQNGTPQRLAYQDRKEYLGLYSGAQGEKYRLDASTGYFALPDVAQVIRNEIGDAKIICVVRQPVDRAYSAYVYHRQLEDTESDTFEEALAEQAKLAANEDVTIPQPYMGTGRYSEHIAAWKECFGDANVHVVFFDDLRESPQATCEAIFRFLDIESMEINPQVERNASHEPLTSWRKFILRASRGGVKAFTPISFILRAVLPPATRNRIRIAIKRNLRPPPGSNRPSKLSSEEHARYTREFHTEIDKLASMTGRTLDHWKAPQEN